MKHVRSYRQETVKAESPEVFDFKMNAIYEKASASGKEPLVHFFDGMGLCASVRYYIVESIPECLADKYELEGNSYVCSECPYFELPTDKRRKNVRCTKSGRLVDAGTRSCDIFYAQLEESHES